MTSKHRIVYGVIFILTGIAVCITTFLGMHENSKQIFSFFSISGVFIWIGIWQIVFSFILKNKDKQSMNKD